ncbi:MAG: hypothetical protein Q4A67_06555 [Aerococcus sp.]|nr:hypothetical protein [Aerococcus sp.]
MEIRHVKIVEVDPLVASDVLANDFGYYPQQIARLMNGSIDTNAFFMTQRLSAVVTVRCWYAWE